MLSVGRITDNQQEHNTGEYISIEEGSSKYQEGKKGRERG